MKHITKSVVRKLLRMKLRLLGISMVIALAMSMVVAGFYTADVFDYSVEKFFEDSRMPDVFYEFSSPSNQTLVENALISAQGVKEYDVRLKLGGIYEFEEEQITTIIIGIKDPNNKNINKLALESGSIYEDTNSTVAVQGMEEKGVKAKAQIQVMVGGAPLNLSVTGTVSSPEFLFPSTFSDYSLPIGGNLLILFMDLSKLQEFYGDAVVNDAVVILEDGASFQDVSGSLTSFDIERTITKDQHPSTLFMRTGAGKMRSMFPVMGYIFMLVGFISIFMTIYRLVKNDSRYIGVMMSLGFEKREIVKSYMVIGLIICIIGGILGSVIAFLFASGIATVSMQMYSSMKLYFPISPIPFLLGWMFIVITVIFSVWIPVRMITGTSVREALDYKPRTRIHSSKFASKRLSRVTLMGLRNSTRNPGRTVLTILVVGITIGAAGSWLVMADSAWGYASDLLDADTWDLKADFTMDLSFNDARNESRLGLNQSDVSYIIPYSLLSGEIRHGGKSTVALITGCNQMDTARDFELESGTLDFGRAVVTIKMAQELGLKAGDDVDIVVGTETVTLEVAGIVYDLLAQTLYTETQNLNPIFPQDRATGVFIQLNDDSLENVKEKAKTLRSMPIVSNVLVQEDISRTFNEVLDSGFAFLYTFFFLNIIIAFVVASSAVIISTMERDVEFATLDTLGIPRRKVAKSIVAEMSILALGAAAVGVPLSYLFGWVLARVMEDVLFFFPIIFIIGASITIFLIGFAFVVLSAGVPIRYSGKLDTEKTIRERTAG